MFDVLFDVMQWNLYDGGNPYEPIRCGDGTDWVVLFIGVVLFVLYALGHQE